MLSAHYIKKTLILILHNEKGTEIKAAVAGFPQLFWKSMKKGLNIGIQPSKFYFFI